MKLHIRYPEAYRGVAHLGIVRHVHQVATGGQFTAARQAETVHLGDHRLGQVPDSHPALGDMSRPLAVAAGRIERVAQAGIAAAKVVTGGKAAARPANNLHPDAVIAIPLLQGMQGLTPQRVVERIALVRAVKGYAPDALGGLIHQHYRITLFPVALHAGVTSGVNISLLCHDPGSCYTTIPTGADAALAGSHHARHHAPHPPRHSSDK